MTDFDEQPENYNISGRDDPRVNTLFHGLMEDQGWNKTRMNHWAKRHWIRVMYDGDAIPEELAEHLAEECESDAAEKEEEAERLREKASELESEAEDLREDASEWRALGDEDLTLDPEEDGTDEETFRDHVVARLARQAKSGQSVTLSTNEDVRNLAREEDADRNAEWLGELRSEIEDAADVAAEDLDIEITAAEAATGW